MGFFDSASNILSFGATGTLDDAANVDFPSISFPGAFGESVLFQFLSLGGDTDKFKIPGGKKAGKKALKELGATKILKIGNEYFNIPTTDDLLAQAQVFQQKILGTKADTEAMLKKIPFLQGIFDEAAGKGNDFIQSAFETVGQAVLGGAAPKGLLSDQTPGLTASVAVPMAQYLKQLQKAGEAQVGSAIGLPGFGPGAQFDPANIVQPQTLDKIFSKLLATKSLDFSSGIPQAQNVAAALATKAGVQSGIGSSLGQSLGLS
jgi:hypothetical protein